MQKRDSHMPQYQIAYHKNTKKVVIQLNGDVLPANIGGQSFINIGTFYHESSQDNLGDNPSLPGEGVLAENHVLFHHVRDALYKRSAANASNTAAYPFNITDMSGITIEIDNIKNNVSIDVTPATRTLTVASPTVQLVTAFTPADSTDKRLTYVSSDPTKATVNATGLVTRVANGSTTITVSTVEGNKQDTVAITVTN